MVLMHILGGMPARGIEFLTIKKKNTWQGMRNVLGDDGVKVQDEEKGFIIIYI